MGSTNTEEEAVAQLDHFRSAFYCLPHERSLTTTCVPAPSRHHLLHWTIIALACVCSAHRQVMPEVMAIASLCPVFLDARSVRIDGLDALTDMGAERSRVKG